MAQLKLQIPRNQETQSARNVLQDLLQVQLFALLGRSGQSSNAERGAVERIAELVWERSFSAGEILIENGQISNDLLIFVEGRAVASRPSQHAFETAQRVLICDPYTSYGEAALIEPTPSELVLTAETDGVLLVLDAASFEQFAHEFPSAALTLQTQFTRQLLRQIKKAQETLRLYQALLEGN